ncbi:MAG: proton-conducting transporter transmembrane domain-containing protein [Ilumatobacteraceae bacterium]
MSTLVVLLPLIPAVVAALIATFGWNLATAWFGPAATVAVAGIGIALAVRVLDRGPVSVFGGQLRVDALSALMVIFIGVVGSISAVYGIAYLRTELDNHSTTTRRAKLYGALMQLTIAAMLVVVVADNLGVLWVAIETTTIATVLLVGHRRDRESVEASWKYLVLGSVGVATALLGTVLVYFVSRHSGVDAASALRWSTLVDHARELDPGALRVAMGFVVVGYGTKAGLAPVHSWIPDAYSQAPAPVAALMSGVLSAMSMYALLRLKVIADITLGAGFVRGLLLVAALLSLAVAASLMVTQRDYKRLLAYSSVEHMGLVALAAAIGSPLAISAALLHLIGHGLAKSVAFCSSGELLFATGTTHIDGVRGLLYQRPFIGATFGLSALALVAIPPFSIFASELAILRAGISDRLTWAIVIVAVLLLVIFAAVAVHSLNMLAGQAATGAGESSLTTHLSSITARIPMIAGLALAALLGITIWPISRLIDTAAKVLAR